MLRVNKGLKKRILYSLAFFLSFFLSTDWIVGTPGSVHSLVDDGDFDEEIKHAEAFFKDMEEEGEKEEGKGKEEEVEEEGKVKRAKAVGEKGEMGPKKPPDRIRRPLFCISNSISQLTDAQLPFSSQNFSSQFA